MDLWIRSQDKKILVPIKDKIELIEFGNVDINIHLTDLIYNGYSLGYYNNERALEVLDEIQNMIKPTLITTEYHSEIKQDIDKLSFDVIMQPVEDKITYIQPNIVIYKMPEK